MSLLRGNSLTLLEMLINNFYGRYLKQTFFVAFVDYNQSSYSLPEVCTKYFYVLFFSSLMQHVFTYPIDRLRTVVLTDFSKVTDRKSTINSKYLYDIIKIEGIGKLYKGFRFSLLCTIPENMVIVTSFALLRERFDLTLFNSIFIGSSISNMLLYPLDSLLRRFQADTVLKKRNSMYYSIYQLILEINKNEGLKGYYKGFCTAAFTHSLATLMYMGLFKSMYTSQIVVY